MEHLERRTSPPVTPPPPIAARSQDRVTLGPAPAGAEPALFNEMAAQHLDALYRTALRLTGRPQDAEDLVQETYLRAWRSLHTYRPGTNPKAWLFRILHNAHIDRFRASARTVPTVDELEGQDPAFVVHETPETLVMAGLMDGEVRQALAEIPEVFRAGPGIDGAAAVGQPGIDLGIAVPGEIPRPRTALPVGVGSVEGVELKPPIAVVGGEPEEGQVPRVPVGGDQQVIPEPGRLDVQE